MWPFTEKSARAIKSGEIAIIPTDTVYGIVASADHREAVEKLYTLRKRDLGKPCILLIAGIEELERFGIQLNEYQKEFLESVWPGAVSVILPVEKKWEYLHRGRGSLAFRVPAWRELREFLKQTGPLLAPSANREGKPTVKNITEAKEVFGDSLSLYIDGGVLESEPSTLIELHETDFTLVRAGKEKIFYAQEK